MQVAGGFVSYDICDVEHYYNTLHRELYHCKIDFVTYFKPEYFIHLFEVVFSSFLCLKVGIVEVINNWK